MTTDRSGIRTILAMTITALCLAWSPPGWSAPLDAETMWKIKRLGPPALTPDGRSAVVPVTAYDLATDEGRTELWLIPSDGGEARALTTGAGNFETPTLVIHGESDYRVPLNHRIELFNTLQNRGVRSRLVYFPKQNHWILTAQDSIFWYSQKRDWLEEFIGRGPSNESN